jgi:polysaccharide pyruvyl transferase WcaK-like protein
MRIALWNGSGLDNLGDRLLDYVNRRELARRLPEASFDTFSPWPAPFMPLVKIDRNGGWAYEGRYDAIVIGGGALLIGPPFVHPTLQTCYLGPYPDRFRDRCPIIWNGVCSDGQFVAVLAEHWRSYIRAATRRLTYRSVRNQRTAELLGECGVSDKISIVPDAVTLLRAPTKRDYRGSAPLRIGLAVGSSGHSCQFLATLTSGTDTGDWNPTVRAPVTANIACANPAMLPTEMSAFVARVSEALSGIRKRAHIEVCGFGAVYDDSPCAAALVEALGCCHISLSDPLGSDALAWIASLDCLIASRLHACILAVVAGTPLVALDPYFSPVAGTSKVREFMAGVGLLDGYASLESFLTAGDTLDEMVETAISNRERLPAIHETLSIAAHAHFDCVAEIIRQRTI